MSITEIHNGISYSPPKEQRGYQPPPAQQEWRAPDVAAPAVKAEGTVVQKSHTAVTHARDEFAKHLAETEALREHFTPEGYAARIAEFQNTSAAKAVDAEFANVTARRDAAAANVEQVKRALSPAGDSAVELRRTRYRDRTLRTLDSKDSGALFEEAQQLVAGADREQLGVLLEELPAYLKSRGSTVDWIDAAVAQAVPEYASAREELKKAESAFVITRQNINSIHRAFKDGHAKVVFTDPSRFDPDI